MLLDRLDRSEVMQWGARRGGVVVRLYGSAPIMPLAWVIVSSHAR
jgi:hypothetical protein